VPSSVTPDGTNAKTATVTVTTTARSWLPRGTHPHIHLRLRPQSVLTWLLGLLVMGLLGCALNRYADFGRRAWAGITAVLLFAVLSFGCGGGSSSSGAQSGTPAGTYTLTVTGASGSLTHTINLTLNVN
jgi:hypothetical protein